MKKGTAARNATLPRELFPFNSRSLREKLYAAWRDAQYAAHAAHAVDPSLLDAGPTAPFVDARAYAGDPTDGGPRFHYPDDEDPSPDGSG